MIITALAHAVAVSFAVSISVAGLPSLSAGVLSAVSAVLSAGVLSAAVLSAALSAAEAAAAELVSALLLESLLPQDANAITAVSAANTIAILVFFFISKFLLRP